MRNAKRYVLIPENCHDYQQQQQQQQQIGGGGGGGGGGVSSENDNNITTETIINEPIISTTPPAAHAAAPLTKEKRRQIDRLTRTFRIILSLAKISGYDDNGRILARDGVSYIQQSNIITLINNSLSLGRRPIGDEDFIALLRKAKVDPDLIVNETIKAQLNINTSSSSKKAVVVAQEEEVQQQQQQQQKQPILEVQEIKE